MQFVVHKPEKWNFFHIIFTNEHGIDRIQTHCWDIKIGEMVGAKNILTITV